MVGLAGLLRVRIDSTIPFEEVGYRKPMPYGRQLAAEGRRIVDEAVADIAREGDRLRDFHLGVDIARESAAAAWPEPKELNIDIAPRTLVDVSFAPGEPGYFFNRLA